MGGLKGFVVVSAKRANEEPSGAPFHKWLLGPLAWWCSSTWLLMQFTNFPRPGINWFLFSQLSVLSRPLWDHSLRKFSSSICCMSLLKGGQTLSNLKIKRWLHTSSISCKSCLSVYGIRSSWVTQIDIIRLCVIFSHMITAKMLSYEQSMSVPIFQFMRE